MNTQERILTLLNYYNMSKSKFAQSIGVKTNQAIYDLASGKTKTISQSIEDKILSCFPEVDRTWLLTGEGDMLKPHPTMSATIGDGAAIAQINSTNNGTMSVTSGNAYQQAAEDDTKAVLAECKALLSQVTTLVSSATQMVNTALAMNADTKKCIQEHHEKIASHTK